MNQVWVIADGRPQGAGMLHPRGNEPPMIPLERDLAGAQMVALTVEPMTGSPGPTGPIVMSGLV